MIKMFKRDSKGRFVGATTDTRDTVKLMAQRVTSRYAPKGSIHSNQGFFAVDRASSGRFVTR